jgi:uncharacterized membrane protein
MSSTEPIEVFVAVYPTEDEAKATLADFRTMEKDGAIRLIDGAVMVKGLDGTVKVTETGELTPGKGAKSGAIVGVVLGVIFPPSILVTGALGAAAGGLIGKLTDTGLFDNTELKEVAEDLDPGSSAIVVVAEACWITQLEKAAKGYDKLATHALDADVAADLLAV